jgi:hypothetical protein
MRQVTPFLNGKALGVTVLVADNFLTRLRGLLARPPLQPEQGLLIRPCSSVHTWFMGYNLDLVYMDKSGKVLVVRTGIKPWRFDLGPSGAHQVLELPSGSIQSLGIAPGARLEMESG